MMQKLSAGAFQGNFIFVNCKGITIQKDCGRYSEDERGHSEHNKEARVFSCALSGR